MNTMLRKVVNKLKISLRVNFYRLFGSQDFEIDGLYGIKYVIDPWSVLDRHIMEKGVLDDWISHQEIIRLPKNAVVMDIGANVGLISLVLAKKYGCSVFAYEPDPKIFEKLERNLQINKPAIKVEPFRIALQDDSKIKSMKLNIRRAIDGEVTVIMDYLRWLKLIFTQKNLSMLKLALLITK